MKKIITREEFVSANYTQLKIVHRWLTEVYTQRRYEPGDTIEQVLYEQGQLDVLDTIESWLVQYESSQQDKVIKDV